MILKSDLPSVGLYVNIGNTLLGRFVKGVNTPRCGNPSERRGGDEHRVGH